MWSEVWQTVQAPNWKKGQRFYFHVILHTAKNQYQKLETNIPRKGIVRRPLSQFPHSCFCERFIYSHDRSASSAAGKMWTDPGISLTDTWMWKLGLRSRNSQKRIHKWDFRCSVFDTYWYKLSEKKTPCCIADVRSGIKPPLTYDQGFER